MRTKEPPEQQLAASLRDTILPCECCRAARTRCEGGFPCDRCYENAIECKPSKKAPLLPSSVMDLLFRSCDSLPLIEGFMRACCRVVEQGRCSRANALRTLRMWRYESRCFGADPTLGLAGWLQQRMGIDAIELEDRGALLWDLPPGALTAEAIAWQARQVAEAQGLLQLEPCQRAALGGAGVYVTRIDKHGRSLRTANAAMASMMGGVGWPGRHVQMCKLTAGVLSASTCAPGDRPLYFEALAENILDDSETAPRRRTELLKGITGNGKGGRVGLYILTLERFEDGDSGLLYLVARLEPAPRSRHTTLRLPRPGSPSSSSDSTAAAATAVATKKATRTHRNLHYFRRPDATGGGAAGKQQTAASCGGGQAQQDARFVFPAIAGLGALAFGAGDGRLASVEGNGATAEALFAEGERKRWRRQARGGGGSSGGDVRVVAEEGPTTVAEGSTAAAGEGPREPLPLSPLGFGGGRLLGEKGPMSIDSTDWDLMLLDCGDGMDGDGDDGTNAIAAWADG